MENDKPERPTTISFLVASNTVFLISSTILLIAIIYPSYYLSNLSIVFLSAIFVCISGFLTIISWLINFFASLSRMDNILFRYSLVYCIYVILAPVVGALLFYIANNSNLDWDANRLVNGLGIATFVLINVAGLIHLYLLRKKQPLL